MFLRGAYLKNFAEEAAARYLNRTYNKENIQILKKAAFKTDFVFINNS